MSAAGSTAGGSTAGGSRGHIVVVGSGGQAYREYSFQALAAAYRVSAVLADEPAWQRRYLAAWRTADLQDETAVAGAVAELLGPGPDEGVLTWDETALEVTAKAAEKLSRPHMSAQAARRCRDKYLMRSLLAEAGLGTVRHGLAHCAAEAAAVADSIGYPVVLKPRALAGSMGVVLVPDAAALPDAFELASGARYATLPTGHGVLLEEYLDGPEISVDSVVRAGEVRCVHVARKRLGFEPHFEEVGHLVTGWAGEPWAAAVTELVTAAHAALRVELGVTHAEVRLTGTGPRLVELNGRLGGDFIPYIGRQATGIDLITVAAELALGRVPRLAPDRQLSAEVRFIYPDTDGVAGGVDLAAAAAVPGIADAFELAPPGTRLLLPPRQPVPRLAALIAVDPAPDACAASLDAAEYQIDTRVQPEMTQRR